MTTREEQKANRRLWCEALRSGRYAQGTKLLRSEDDEFCCLGVAADIAGVEWHRGFGKCYYRSDAGFNSTIVLTSDVAEKFGLADVQGSFCQEPGEMSLAILNDNGVSFEEIARVIEAEPEGLLVDGEAAPRWGEASDADHS